MEKKQIGSNKDVLLLLHFNIKLIV